MDEEETPRAGFELDRRVCEEVGDELREEVRIVTHALAQLVEHGAVQYVPEIGHVGIAGREPRRVRPAIPAGAS